MKLLTALIMVLASLSSHAQLKSLGKPRPFTRQEIIMDSINHHCRHDTKLSAVQRLAKYPFTHANEVRLVSFPTKKFTLGNEIPKKNNKVDTSQLRESILLSKDQVDTLTDILYNVGYKGEFYSYEKGCYIPRNAILFLNPSKEVFAYIELCFQCNGYQASSKKVNAGQFCTEKYDLLQSFFSKVGIKYGTEDPE